LQSSAVDTVEMLGSWLQAGTQQKQLRVACYDPRSLRTPGCKPVAGVHVYHKTVSTFSPVLPPSTRQEVERGGRKFLQNFVSVNCGFVSVNCGFIQFSQVQCQLSFKLDN
jgi:hypothetical protein